MDHKDFAETYLTGLRAVLDRFDVDAFDGIVRMILAAYAEDHRIFIMGNGGSGATASHFACDLNKGCCMDLDRKFKVICLNDNVPTMLALANDVSFDAVFDNQLRNFFDAGDLVIGISGSGNSENVLRAVGYAAAHGGRTIGLTGFSGGRLAGMVDVAFVAPVADMQKVEDLHMIVVHMIMQAVYARLHGGAAPC